jgi:uncharacterized protein (DUF433 family)
LRNGSRRWARFRKRTRPGRITQPRADLGAVSATGGAQPWISSPAAPPLSPATVQHVTIDTPVLAPADQLCGRIVFSDFHVANAITGMSTFPTECDTSPLTDPTVRLGRPVIRGTRVPVDVVVGQMAAGLSADQVAEEYAITRDDVLAALAYAAKLLAAEQVRAVG